MKKLLIIGGSLFIMTFIVACDGNQEGYETNIREEQEPTEGMITNEVLSDGLIGVWQSDSNENSFVTFLIDGTGYRGSTMTTRRIEWEKESNDLLITNFRGHSDYKFRLENDNQTLILIRQTTGSEFSHSRVDNPDEIIAMQRNFLGSDHHVENLNLEAMSEMSLLELMLDNFAMEQFEAEHAVSEEQARYLAFSPFLMLSNFESPHVFYIHCMWSGTDCAADILANFWNITDEVSAMRSLESLSNANGQRGIADDIWGLIQNGQTNLLDPEVGFDLTGLEEVVTSASNQAKELIELLLEDDELVEQLLLMMALDGIDIEGYWQGVLYDELILFVVSERVNAGLTAFERAITMLIEDFGFTEEELLGIKTLAAWDYGRVSIIARYGVAAGFLDEVIAWEHLQLAAKNAVESYSSWREYTAAHVLGRAIAFGNDSHDMKEVLEFLFNHDESPFERHEFNLNE